LTKKIWKDNNKKRGDKKEGEVESRRIQEKGDSGKENARRGDSQ